MSPPDSNSRWADSRHLAGAATPELALASSPSPFALKGAQATPRRFSAQQARNVAETAFKNAHAFLKLRHNGGPKFLRITAQLAEAPSLLTAPAALLPALFLTG